MKSEFGTSGVKTDVNGLQSVTIDVLRFPLAIMVIFIHMSPDVFPITGSDVELLSVQGILNVVYIFFSRVLTQIAVPTFFLISGFLFFLNFQKWSWDGWKSKMRSRVKSLLIPYILWNLMAFLFAIIHKLGRVYIKGMPVSELYSLIWDNSWHIIYDCNVWGTDRINWLGESLCNTGPFVMPLWFLRDLIVVTAFTPLIFYCVKKLRLSVVIVLLLAYVSRIWTLVPGFSITAFFFYTLGAYLSLNKVNLSVFTDRYKYMFLIPACILLIAATVFYDTVAGQNIMPFWVVSGVLALIGFVSYWVRKYDLRPNRLLVSSCFFVYAFHGAYIPAVVSPLLFVKDMLHYAIPDNSAAEEFICYFMTPFLMALICLLVLTVCRKLMPKTTLLFSGNK